MKKILILTVFAAGLCLFVGCGKDNDEPKAPPADLLLDANKVELIEGETATVAIKTGNGGYKISGGSEVASASLSGNSIAIQAKKYGEITLTVSDKEQKSAALQVVVKSKVLSDATPRFVWGATRVELYQPNGWQILLSPNQTGVSNVDTGQGYCLRKEGSVVKFSEGLYNPVQETATNTYEVLETAELYAVQWTVGSVKGELVLPKAKVQGILVP